MIELKQDQLVIHFPEVHRDASLRIDFQRTLRIPDDDRDYPLPAGLGRFPVRHVDDFAERIPPRWLRHGGVMMPMHQSEALWLNFSSYWPMAVKVAAGKTNAVTGKPWTDALNGKRQDYLVTPEQPWLDGFCVRKGVIRQFVAMPLGAGYSAEEQITGAAEHGGLQIAVWPMKKKEWEKRQREKPQPFWGETESLLLRTQASDYECLGDDMALAPGGRMRQKIYDDPHPFQVWDLQHHGRCFVHLANSQVWRAVTGTEPPTMPLTAKEYQKAGIPWFDLYDEKGPAVTGSGILGDLKSVAAMGEEKGDVPLPDNRQVKPGKVVKLWNRLRRGQVREENW